MIGHGASEGGLLPRGLGPAENRTGPLAATATDKSLTRLIPFASRGVE